jgi:hypothetical protein
MGVPSDGVAPRRRIGAGGFIEHPGRTLTGGQLFWSDDRGTDSGTAIGVRSGIAADPLRLRSEGSYLAAVKLRVDQQPTLVVSVHVGPPNYRRHLRGLVGVLSEAVAGYQFVVGGDLNAARHVDVV